MIIMIRKKKLLQLTSLAAVLAVAIAGLGVTSKILDKNAVSTSADGNWGLSFQQAGQPPVANATADYLKKFDAYYAEDTKEKAIEAWNRRANADVEVVRCKDCIYWSNDGRCEPAENGLVMEYTTGLDFYSYGKRKEENNEN